MILGFCVEKPPEMGMRDPNAQGFGGGSPFVGVSVGLLGSILGFCVEKPPQMGLRDPSMGGVGGWSSHFWGFWGTFWGSVWRIPLKWG